MSAVDTRLSDDERAAYLAEVRTHLPAFLAPAAAQQHDPVGDVRELLRLDARDLDRVVAVHLCLSAPVQRFLEALDRGLRQPITSSERPPVISQAVRGSIDWGATIRTRGLAAGDPTLYVTRPARRVFDVPENRSLRWLLEALDVYLRRAMPRAFDEARDEEQANWGQQLRAGRKRLARARQNLWLRDVPAERPTAQTFRRLRAARTSFYADLIPEAAKVLMRYGERPTEADLTDLLCQRYFRPNEDWRLFEVVVALRLARRFAERSPHKRRARLLTGVGGGAYARYTLPEGDAVALYYQSWPDGLGASAHAKARDQHQLNAGPSRPDLVIKRTGKAPDAAVLELKASRSDSYLASGLSQLLGYLGERPDAWRHEPSGWLVAPASVAFRSASPAAGEPLWMLTSDGVAAAAVERFAP